MYSDLHIPPHQFFYRVGSVIFGFVLYTGKTLYNALKAYKWNHSTRKVIGFLSYRTGLIDIKYKNIHLARVAYYQISCHLEFLSFAYKYNWYCYQDIGTYFATTSRVINTSLSIDIGVRICVLLVIHTGIGVSQIILIKSAGGFWSQIQGTSWRMRPRGHLYRQLSGSSSCLRDPGGIPCQMARTFETRSSDFNRLSQAKQACNSRQDAAGGCSEINRFVFLRVNNHTKAAKKTKQ